MRYGQAREMLQEDCQGVDKAPKGEGMAGTGGMEYRVRSGKLLSQAALRRVKVFTEGQ